MAHTLCTGHSSGHLTCLLVAAGALPFLTRLPGGSEGGVTLVELVPFPVLPVLPQVCMGQRQCYDCILFASPEPRCVPEKGILSVLGTEDTVSLWEHTTKSDKEH